MKPKYGKYQEIVYIFNSFTYLFPLDIAKRISFHNL